MPCETQKENFAFDLLNERARMVGTMFSSKTNKINPLIPGDLVLNSPAWHKEIKSTNACCNSTPIKSSFLYQFLHCVLPMVIVWRLATRVKWEMWIVCTRGSNLQNCILTLLSLVVSRYYNNNNQCFSRY